jgi:hypothetical protein
VARVRDEKRERDPAIGAEVRAHELGPLLLLRLRRAGEAVTGKVDEHEARVGPVVEVRASSLARPRADPRHRLRAKRVDEGALADVRAPGHDDARLAPAGRERPLQEPLEVLGGSRLG